MRVIDINIKINASRGGDRKETEIAVISQDRIEKLRKDTGFLGKLIAGIEEDKL